MTYSCSSATVIAILDILVVIVLLVSAGALSAGIASFVVAFGVDPSCVASCIVPSVVVAFCVASCIVASCVVPSVVVASCEVPSAE